MKTMGISEFKAKCIAVIKEARQTSTPVIITRRGEPIVRIEPINIGRAQRKLGALRSEVTIKGDIVSSPFGNDWEMER